MKNKPHPDGFENTRLKLMKLFGKNKLSFDERRIINNILLRYKNYCVDDKFDELEKLKCEVYKYEQLKSLLK